MRRALLLPWSVLGVALIALAGCGSAAPRGTIAFSGVVHGVPGIYEVDVSGADVRRVASGGSQLEWSPDGVRLAFVRNGVVWTVLGPSTAHVVVRGPVYEYSWSPDGTRIAYRGDDFRLFVAALGEPVRQLTADGRAPAWSPDGRLIAFLTSVAHVNDQGETEYVAVVRPDGTGRTRLQIALSASVAWSPDSGQLAFSVSDGHLYTVRPNGTDLRIVVPGGTGADWSPDGRRIAYSDASGTWVVDADGRHPKRISPLGYASWSPDGRWVAVQGARVIEIVPAGGGKPRIVVEAGSIDSVAWRPASD